MEELMFEETYKVYIQVNENNVVTRVDSEWNINDLENWTFIDEGSGDKFHHAQSGYLEKGLFDDVGRFNYKYENETLIELTKEEKDILYPVQPIAASFEEEQLDFNLEIDYRVSCLELGTTAAAINAD